MFVRDFIHVDQPFEVVAPRFVSDTSWLAPLAEEAAEAARDLALSLVDGGGRGTGNGREPRRDPGLGAIGTIRWEAGPVRARARSILVPMWLITEGGDPALPDLTGDLEVAPVGSTRSLIALSATYRRTTQERDAIHRVERATEAGVRSFLNGIAAYLARPVSTV